MKTRYFAAILAVVLFASCSSSDEEVNPAGPGSMVPIVTGIRMTFETGQFAGNWGSPTDGPDDGRSSFNEPGLMVLYPNPCAGKCPAVAVLVKRGTARMWVVPARLGGLGPDMEAVAGAYTVAPNMRVVKTLSSGDRVLEAGVHNFEWDGTDDWGNRVPSGFYRIFLLTDNTLYWRDLLLVGTYEELRNIILGRD